MRKSFLVILILALFLAFISLAYYREIGDCPPNPGPNMGLCVVRSVRGFPSDVPLDEFNGYFLPSEPRIFSLIFYQTTGFIFNTIFYFLIISALYFGYSKLVKKTKKK